MIETLEKCPQVNFPKELYLTPINPFTYAQARVLACFLQNSTTDCTIKGLARALKSSPRVVKNHIYGKYEGLPASEISDRSRLGILGVVERITGTRPNGLAGLITTLFNDVVLVRDYVPVNSAIDHEDMV